MKLKPNNQIGFNYSTEKQLNTIKGDKLIFPSVKEYKLNWFRRDGVFYVEITHEDKKLVLSYDKLKELDKDRLFLNMTEEELERQFELKELIQAVG